MSYFDKQHRVHRNKLHHTKMSLFLKWVETQGYIIHPRPEKSLYEVGRIEKFTPQGNNPHIVFYKRERTEHITVPREAEALVNRFIRWYQNLSKEELAKLK